MACSPGGSPLNVNLIRTPAGACVSSAEPTSLPALSLSVALAVWAAAGDARPPQTMTMATAILRELVHVMVELLWSRRHGPPDEGHRVGFPDSTRTSQQEFRNAV